MNTSKSKSRNIRVHIERLILDGLSVPHSQRSRLQTAIEEELAHLLANGTLAVDLQTHGLLSSLNGGTIELTGNEEPRLLGKRIAQAVYRGIGQ
ncbi:MAG: hypothetical protein ACYDER_02865 [Ktedonobacteraceae bacterium]